MEMFTKEELLIIYFALNNTQVKAISRRDLCFDDKVKSRLTREIIEIDDLIDKVDRMGKELCTH